MAPARAVAARRATPGVGCGAELRCEERLRALRARTSGTTKPSAGAGRGRQASRPRARAGGATASLGRATSQQRCWGAGSQATRNDLRGTSDIRAKSSSPPSPVRTTFTWAPASSASRSSGTSDGSAMGSSRYQARRGSAIDEVRLADDDLVMIGAERVHRDPRLRPLVVARIVEPDGEARDRSAPASRISPRTAAESTPPLSSIPRGTSLISRRRTESRRSSRRTPAPTAAPSAGETDQ